MIFQQQVIKCDSLTLFTGALEASEQAAESDVVTLGS